MSLKDTIEKFLETISESSVSIYRSKIEVFHNFLIVEKGITNKSYQSYLEAMKINEIEESLNYFIESNQIKSQSITWNFISVVKRYFGFIYVLGIKNDNLIKAFGLSVSNPDSFQFKLNEKILNDPRLEKKNVKSEISWEEAQILISECDQRMKELKDENKILDYNKNAYKYKDYMSSIIIKLILFTGLTYQEVPKIEYGNVNRINNTISINGYCVHLPNRLSEQLTYYIELRNEMNKSSKLTEPLFILDDGTKLRKQTSLVAETLKEYTGRSDLTGIVKFAVIEMIKKGVNQSIIQDFTKVGDKNYQYCQKQVNQSKNPSVSRYLDSKLRSIEIFDML